MICMLKLCIFQKISDQILQLKNIFYMRLQVCYKCSSKIQKDFLHCRPPYKQQRGNFSRLMKNLSNFAEISNSMRIWWRSTKLRSADWSCDLSCLTTASWSNSCTLNCCRKIRSTATDIFCVLTVPARIFKTFFEIQIPTLLEYDRDLHFLQFSLYTSKSQVV